MNTSSLKSCVRLPRVMLLMAALLVPQIVFGWFNLPNAPVTGVSYPLSWSGTVYGGGSYALIWAKPPGDAAWRVFGSGGISPSYGQCTINTNYVFNVAGTWNIKVTSSLSGFPIVETTSLNVIVAPNVAPTVTITVDGHNPNDVVTVGTTVTVRYRATDVNGNLSGIRYNIWNATTGYFDNGGDGFVSQSGSSGEVTRTVTLSPVGDWYFWTDAQDSLGAYSSTGDWGSGFKLVVTGAPTWTTPAYEPWYWNDEGTVQYYNNCYNYSNNRRTDTFAQPGRASGNMYTSITAAEVANGAISDGLEPTDANSVSPSGKTKIALVIWPGYDYHWYRKDNDGYWTHKPGGTHATNLDNSGNVITNPEVADRGGYLEFAGYFFTPSDQVQGQGHANIR